MAIFEPSVTSFSPATALKSFTLNQETKNLHDQVYYIAFANKLIYEALKNCILYYIYKTPYCQDAIQCLNKNITSKNKAIYTLQSNSYKDYSSIIAYAFIHRKDISEDYFWIFNDGP